MIMITLVTRSSWSPSLRPHTVTSGANFILINLVKLSTLKIAVFANANISLPEESSYNNSHTYTNKRHLNLDIFICNHKSWMSLWAEIFISHIVKNWGNNSIKILGHASTYDLASMARLFTVENDSIAFFFILLSYIDILYSFN